ncbi:hypothetical protein B0H66DRAFT_620953 [Apodospora peruviana]|uniref:Uncharacterized protein n=1 Tax=Apodospora peruviana TaxID=516989 RepID=A0AAE0ID43_9PEZI|nr:hypothetical protein B0H66DRAFT_620953 [Apodospora peruviana]
MGNAGKQFISQTGAICSCQSRALQMYGKNLYKSVEEGKDLSAAVSSLIRDSIELQKCIADNGFHIQDNKDELLATGDLSPMGGWTVIQAAEIDLTSYGELIAAIPACAVGDCEPTLIKNFFTNYLTKSRELMADRTVNVFNGWIDIFSNIETKIGNVGDAAVNYVAQLKEVPARLDEIRAKVCKDGSCAGEVTTALLSKVSEAVAAVQAFQNIGDATTTIVETIPKLVSLARNAVEFAEAAPNLDYLIKLAGEAKFIQRLRTPSRPSTSSSRSHGSDGGRNAIALIEDVLTDNWQSYQQPTNSTGNIRTTVTEIQELLRVELQAPFRNVTDAIRELETALDTFPVKEGKFTFAAGVVSYQR